MRPTLHGLLLCLALAASGCGGCRGGSCEADDDCRQGLRCELRQCVGEDQSACGYLRRCLQKTAPRAAALLGQRLVRELESHPDEQACRQRLRLLGSTGKGDALLKACGKRVAE